MNRQDLSLDYLPNTLIQLYQHPKMFKINTDTCLLGEFLEDLSDVNTIVDIGVNNGALLLYAGQISKAKLIGVDINEEALQIAKINLEMNGLLNYHLIHEKVQKINLTEIDVVIANPPFFPVFDSRKMINENRYLSFARHEVHLSLEELIYSTSKMLKKGGKFFFVHRHNRKNEVLELCLKFQLYPYKLQVVMDKEVETSILLECIFGVKQDLQVLEPKHIHRS